MRKSRISILLLLLTCKTIPIQEKEAKQIADIESVKEAIKNSNLPPAVKAKDIKILDSSEQMISDQGQTITQQDEKIKSLKWYEHLVWIAGSVLLIVVGFIAYQKFKNLSPL